MRPNKLRQLLRDGKPSVGTHLHSIWPSLVEIVGHAGGYDYIEFSGEYAPYDMYGLEHWCRAAELMDLGTLIKLDQEPRTWLAQRAIGAGFQATLFADIHSPEEAAEGVRAVRPDTPGGGGIYGATDRRHSYWGFGGSQAFVDALKDIVIMVMIEKREAVERLDEILAVPGIDMVQWGPSDYAMSIGKPGGWNLPEVKKTELQVLERCLAKGIQPRAEINDPEEARPYLEMGVKHFCIGTDTVILHDWFASRGRALGDLVGHAAG
jgi:2-keto-3-deoxy-L-rhamnonate aldolase RhmA